MTAWDEALNLGMDFDYWTSYKEEGMVANYSVEIECAWHEDYIKRELNYADLMQLEGLVADETGVIIMAVFGDDTIQIEFAVDNSEDMDFEEATDMAWPVIAAVQNFLDPGSFGCQYAFDREEQ